MSMTAYIEKTGGITLDHRFHEINPNRGLLVTVYSSKQKSINAARVELNGLKSSLHHAFNGKISNRIYFGIYKFQDGQHYSADISLLFDEKDIQAAFALGELLNQEAIWDCRQQTCVMTGGTGTGEGIPYDLIRILADGLEAQS